MNDLIKIDSLSFEPLNEYWFDSVWSIEQKAHQSPWQKSMIYQIPSNHHYQQVLHHKKQLIGYFYTQLIADEATLLNIAIDQRFKNQGYGTQLLNFLLKELRIKGAKSIWLEVRESNDIAQRLYERNGFNLVDTRFNYYPKFDKHKKQIGYENALIMTIDL